MSDKVDALTELVLKQAEIIKAARRKRRTGDKMRQVRSTLSRIKSLILLL